MRRAEGFTLIELMIVVVVIGILAAIAIPNFISMETRAHEAGVKANMHSFQLAAEDYGVMHDGYYAPTAAQVIPLVPGGDGGFKNSFDSSTGDGNAWEDRTTFAAPASTIPGITSYADSASNSYNVKGYGKAEPVTIILTSGSG